MKRKLTLQLLAIFLLSASLDAFLQFQLIRMHRNDQVLDVSLQLSALRARIEKEVTANLLIVQGTADFISVVPELDSELFDEYAQKALEGTDLLKNLTAAPNFKMRFVYPLKGNEAILGLDYRELPGQWEQARKAKQTGEMVVAGPLELVQGGTGLIGRAPVFSSTNGERRFWGIVSSVIDAEKLFDKVELAASDLNISIRGKDGKGLEGGVFLGDPELFETSDTVRMPVTFPAGKWIIAALPRGGWSINPPLAPLVHALLALLMTVTGIGVYRAAKRNHTLQVTRESLNQAQAIAHLGSWRLDYTTESIWWSDETYRIFGVERDSFTPTLQGFMNIVHPADREHVLNAFSSSVDSCEMYSVDHRIILPDGEIRHVQERGETVCLADSTQPSHSTGTVLDITDRVHAEEALRASEEKMRAMSEASYDALIVIDPSDTISFWSPAAERMFGWSKEEAIGRKMHPLITPEEYHPSVQHGLRHFAGSGQGPVIGTVQEFTAIRKNGEEFPVERSVSSFKLGDSFLAVGSLRDITERKRIEQELKSYADRLTLASKAGGIGVWQLNLRTGSLEWDEQMFRLYDVKPGEFSGLYEAWRSRLHPDDLEKAENALQRAVHSMDLWDYEFRVIWSNGQIRHIKAAALIKQDGKGVPELVIGVNWDVNEARVHTEQLRLMATTDDMTKLYNRRRFMELVEREMERSRRYPAPFSLVMFDADRFKAVNDTYGHDVGDMVLKAIATTARDVLREVDIIGRLGGEEFAAGLPATDLDNAMLVAERLRTAMEQVSVRLADGRLVTFTVSLGVAELDDSCKDMGTLLKHADLALYAAKKNGRNRIERYTPDIA